MGMTAPFGRKVKDSIAVPTKYDTGPFKNKKKTFKHISKFLKPYF